MNGLLASLRFPFALRGQWATAAVPATAAPLGAVDAAARASGPFRTLAHPETARPTAVLDPAPDPAAPVPALPVEPSIQVSAAHLVDPVGLRVVPFRPTTRWPLRRAAPRIYDPFRGFPLRSLHLADLMDRRPVER